MKYKNSHLLQTTLQLAGQSVNTLSWALGAIHNRWKHRQPNVAAVAEVPAQGAYPATRTLQQFADLVATKSRPLAYPAPRPL